MNLYSDNALMGRATILSLAQLHALLCFLMTRFYQDRSAKTAQFIVSHIRLVIEHPEVRHSEEHVFLYRELLQHWQQTTRRLLRQTASH